MQAVLPWKAVGEGWDEELLRDARALPPIAERAKRVDDKALALAEKSVSLQRRLQRDLQDAERTEAERDEKRSG